MIRNHDLDERAAVYALHLTKVYIAAPFELREEAIRVMCLLEEYGIDVTSSWLRDDVSLENDDPTARLDLADVSRADVLLLLNPEDYRRSGTGGRHVEFGYALALGKRIVILGVRSNIFHYLDAVRVISRVEDL